MSDLPLRRGIKPSRKQRAHPDLVRRGLAYRGQLAILVEVGHFPNLNAICYALNHPIPVTALNSERLTKLAGFLRHTGPIWAPDEEVK